MWHVEDWQSRRGLRVHVKGLRLVQDGGQPYRMREFGVAVCRWGGRRGCGVQVRAAWAVNGNGLMPLLFPIGNIAGLDSHWQAAEFLWLLSSQASASASVPENGRVVRQPSAQAGPPTSRLVQDAGRLDFITPDSLHPILLRTRRCKCTCPLHATVPLPRQHRPRA